MPPNRLPAARRRARVAASLSALVFAGLSCRRPVAEPTAGADASSDAVATTCVEATRGVLERFVDIRGRVATAPGGTLPVEPLVAGYIVEIDVVEGARVKKGALIATVDDLAPKSAAAEAQAAVARSRASKVQADAALERVKKLENLGISSKADLETAQATADAAKGDVAAQEASLGLAAGTLHRVEVRSMFDGVVTKVLRGPGALVDGVDGNNPTPIVELAADGVLEFVGDATERELDILAVGAPADVTLASSAAVLHGEVVSIARGLDPKTGLGAVRIALVPPEGGFDAVRIGAFSGAHVHAKPVASTVAIPRAALRGSALDGAEVGVCDKGKIALRKVRIGYRDADRVEVREGIDAGDHVAIGDMLGLADGTSIEEVAPFASAIAPPASASGPAPL